MTVWKCKKKKKTMQVMESEENATKQKSLGVRMNEIYYDLL